MENKEVEFDFDNIMAALGTLCNEFYQDENMEIIKIDMGKNCFDKLASQMTDKAKKMGHRLTRIISYGNIELYYSNEIGDDKIKIYYNEEKGKLKNI